MRATVAGTSKIATGTNDSLAWARPAPANPLGRMTHLQRNGVSLHTRDACARILVIMRNPCATS